MNNAAKIVAIAFSAALVLTIMGFQSWRRFPLLWGVIGFPTALGYAVGAADGERDTRRRIQNRAARLTPNPETLAHLLEVIDDQP